MARHQTVNCDRCGSKDVGTFDHLEGIDLCSACLLPALLHAVGAMTAQQRQQWIARVKDSLPPFPARKSSPTIHMLG